MRIAFLGDVALIGQFSYSDKKTVTKRIAYLRDLLKDYDYVVANLESPLTNKRKTTVPKSMHIRADESSVQVLKLLGINAVSLANNHMFDYGKKGLDDTIKVLNQAGIKWYGVYGKSLVETIKGERVSFSGFCCYSTNAFGYSESNRGINVLTPSALKEQLNKDIKEKNFSVLSLHWGIEHTNYPAIEHIELIKELAVKYQFIVHGHHPHQIQGIQRCNTSLVAYSLGNAIFDKCASIYSNLTVELNEYNRRSFVLGVTINSSRIQQYSISGFYIGNNGIKPYSIEKELALISQDLDNIDDETSYQNKRIEQYSKVIKNKFGSHNIHWFLSRINYFAIGAKFISIINSRHYSQTFNVNNNL